MKGAGARHSRCNHGGGGARLLHQPEELMLASILRDANELLVMYHDISSPCMYISSNKTSAVLVYCISSQTFVITESELSLLLSLSLFCAPSGHKISKETDTNKGHLGN